MMNWGIGIFQDSTAFTKIGFVRISISLRVSLGVDIKEMIHAWLNIHFVEHDAECAFLWEAKVNSVRNMCLCTAALNISQGAISFQDI